MRNIDWTAFASITIPLIAIFGPIWPAVSAKRLGNLPYRWGMYVGIEALLAAFSFGVDAFRNLAHGAVPAFAAFILMTALALVAGAGVLQRRKWGVVVFGFAFSLSLTLPAIYAVVGTPIRGRITGEGILVLILLAISIKYFRRRWELMS